MVPARIGKIKAVVNLNANMRRNMTDPVRERIGNGGSDLKIRIMPDRDAIVATALPD
jgi:hypothetical protein